MLSVLEQRFMETVIRQLPRITENLEKLIEMKKQNSKMKYKMPREDEPAGNAFNILAMVILAMRDHCLEDEVSEYVRDATSSDYKHLREVSQRMLDRINK